MEQLKKKKKKRIYKQCFIGHARKRHRDKKLLIAKQKGERTILTEEGAYRSIQIKIKMAFS